MTRFKQLVRIEAALEHRNQPELRRALAYVRMRLSIQSPERQVSQWRRLDRQIVRSFDRLAGDAKRKCAD
jgi:hypothetical protein